MQIADRLYEIKTHGVIDIAKERNNTKYLIGKDMLET